MTLNKIKYNAGEIEGVRCKIVESGISESRMIFLKNLLEYNKFEVKVAKDKDSDNKYTIGVTDILFNPVYAVYDRILKTPEDHRVSPAYWEQDTTVCDPHYWIFKK
jgi:hypothetical protein